MAAVTICSDFGAPKNKVWHCFHCFSIYFPWSDRTRCHDNIQTTNTAPWGNRKPAQSITSKDTELLIKFFPIKQKSRTRCFHWWNLPNIDIRINTNTSQTLPKTREWDTSKLIFCGQHYPDTKTRQRHYKNIKIEASTPDDWRRQWQPTPVLLPGKSHGQRSLVGCSPWGR